MSPTGASREIFNIAGRQEWTLHVSPWMLRETRDNLVGKSPQFARMYIAWRMLIVVEDDELTFDWPVDFDVSKDKPVLFTALACADVLLTLDRRDFGDLLDKTIYGLRVLTPGAFLRSERGAGRLR